MKKIHWALGALLLLNLACPYAVSSQDQKGDQFSYEVNKAYPVMSVSENELRAALTLEDLNRHFKPSWVKEYISVAVTTTHEGSERKAFGKSNALNKEQKESMIRADVGTGISVVIQYIPDNTLKHNDPKEIRFSFVIEPQTEASFPGGTELLHQYLKENAVDKIAAGSFKNFDLAAVNFTISEEGEVIDAHLFESMYQTFKNDEVDELLLKTVCNMPKWKPARYSNGTPTAQKFVLSVGNMKSCLVPLLNIDRLPSQQ